MTTLYKSFSSVGKKDTATDVYDIDAVKADLLNHLSIRYGEVPGRPGFGTGIYSYFGDPHDDIFVEAIKADVNRVIAYDPRVESRSVEVFSDPDNHVFLIRAELLFVEIGAIELLNMEIGI